LPAVPTSIAVMTLRRRQREMLRGIGGVVLVVIVLGGTSSSSLKVDASLDPSQPPSFTYISTGAFELDLSGDEHDEQQQQQPSSSIVQSGVLYHATGGGAATNKNGGGAASDSGCFVSAHAILMEDDHCDEEAAASSSSSASEELSSLWMMHGGSNANNNNNMASELLRQLEEALENQEDNSDDEDDDNDDNDGSSSMLSNASLRHRVSAYGAVVSNNERGAGVATTRRKPGATTSSSSSFNSVLTMRGGAINMQTALSSEISKKLITTALVTLVFEAAIGHILEFLKIVMQTSETTYWNVLQQITADKGIAGLWDGFCPWGIVQAVFKGAVFGLAHAAAAGVLVPKAEQGKLPLPLALTLAGGIGGGFQGYVLSPTLLLKTRVMTNPVFREKMSIWRTTVLSFRIGFDVVKTEGFMTLMKGSNVFATKRVFDWSSRYFFADLFEALFVKLKNGEPLTVAEKSVSSLLGGVASTCVTLPLDVLVAKTQDAKKAGVKVSPIKLFRDELKDKGLSGLRNAYMRGFEARLLHVCLTTVVVKTFTPLSYEALFGSAKA